MNLLPAAPALRLMLVGCGAVARRHVEALRRDPRIAWTCFCDPRREAAQAFADAYAAPNVTVAVETDFARAVARGDCDAAILCSPNALHYRQTCAALDAGLHVLCEKPLAVERRHVDDLVDRAARSGRIVSIAHQRRYKSAYVTARRELQQRSELYGAVRQIHIFTCENWSAGIVGTWRNDPTQNLGYCGDAGIHQIDVVRFATGLEPLRLSAASERRDRRVEIVTRILAEWSGGAGLSAHYVGDAHHWREDVHFHCERADLLLRNEQLFRCRDGRTEPILDLEPDGDPATALVDAILIGKPIATPPEIARPICAWNAAVAASIRNGGAWVDVV